MNHPTTTADARVFSPHGASAPASRDLLVESALTIRLVGRTDVTVMRTPGNDRELVLGFLLTEGFIRSLDDMAVFEQCDDANGDAVRVVLADTAPTNTAARGMLVGSSCSLCGRERIDAILGEIAPVDSDTTFPVRSLAAVPRAMRTAQPLFERTGASHAAALFDPDGALLVTREDIGRHNALDKVIGNALLTGLTRGACGAMLSGRASFEMVAKAARAGIPLVAAVSAPSALAVETADQLNVTLCGFVRGADFTCYARPERLT